MVKKFNNYSTFMLLGKTHFFALVTAIETTIRGSFLEAYVPLD